LKSKVSIVAFDGSNIERMCKKLLEILTRMISRISESNVGDPLSDKLRDITNLAKDKWYLFRDQKQEIEENWHERMGVWQSSNKYREIDHKHISEITASAIKNMEKVKEIRV
jgi:hypothetical protein